VIRNEEKYAKDCTLRDCAYENLIIFKRLRRKVAPESDPFFNEFRFEHFELTVMRSLNYFPVERVSTLGTRVLSYVVSWSRWRF